MTGSVPAKRLQTQISEAPACVQNAMMTKDKKPFTYTPGGIDLSQIKSPRMAKREFAFSADGSRFQLSLFSLPAGISMNANSPGVQPKVSPLAQNSTNGCTTPAVPSTPQTPLAQGSIPPPPPPPSMGSLAMGMPFQVFPTGPPVKSSQLSTPQTNGNSNRKSPQSFEPPPMGCRPEIKIPANPMAILRSAPRPQPKGQDFWVQEYVQEKARNSVPSEEEMRQQFMSSPIIQQQQQKSPSPPRPAQKQPSPIRYAQRSPSPEPQREVTGPVRNFKLEDMRTASPIQGQRSSPVMNQSPVPPSMPSPASPQVTMEPIQAFKPQPQAYQPQPQVYQQSQPQVYQQPAQSYQPAPPQGGKIILSTMPQQKQQQNAQQHVSPPRVALPAEKSFNFLLPAGLTLHPATDEY